MTRDYSNRRDTNSGRGKSRSNGKRKHKPQAKRRKAANKRAPGKAGLRGLVWLVSGLCIGLTVAAFIYIVTRPTSHPGRDFTRVEVTRQTATEDSEPSGSADTSDKSKTAAEDSGKPEFAFYEMLPNYNVVIPQEHHPDNTGDSDSNGNHDSTVVQAQPAEPETHEPQSAAPAMHDQGLYVIQAGSFSSRKDANQRKAALTLLGMQPRVIRHRLDSGQVVYRVRSRTIDSSNRLDEMLTRLHQQGIATLVLRRSR